MSDSTNRKIDPLLQPLAEFDARSSNIGDFTETSSPSISVLIAFDGTRQELAALGVSVSSFEDNIATGTIRPGLLQTVASDPRVESIEAARPMMGELDLSREAIAATALTQSGKTGKGAIVGIVDTGIDWQHRAFRKPDGSSAIAGIWDQTLTPVDGETSPDGYGYGVEYNRDRLNSELDRNSPSIRHRDWNGHGTHVAAIATGRAEPYRGIAPDADLIVVATSHDAKALGDSARTLDAVRYIFNKAASLGRPAVVNLSLGSNLGPHDGTSLLERGIDSLLTSPGRSLVKAAGNEGGKGSHASGTLSPGETRSLAIEMPAGSREAATIDLWYEGSQTLEAVLVAPDGSSTPEIAGDEVREYYLSGGDRVLISSILGNPGNGDNRIYLVLAPYYQTTMAPGRWTLILKAGESEENCQFHAWIERGSHPPYFPAEVADDRTTLSIPGTARRCITVGAFGSNTSGHTADLDRPLLPFSSRGPTRDGRDQPVLAAPGANIAAARSQWSKLQAFGNGAWTLMSGTSMAAPHVTGAIAVLLQDEPQLTAEQIRDRLQESAQAQPEGKDPDGWGTGALNLAGLGGSQRLPEVSVASPYDRTAAAPTFKVSSGDNTYYALEVANNSELFQPSGRSLRRYADNSGAGGANFFASWRTQPLQRGAIYTLPEMAWRSLRDAPHLYYRIVTSARGDRWTEVVRSTPDSAIAQLPKLVLHSAVTPCGRAFTESVKHLENSQENSQIMSTQNNQPNQANQPQGAIGEPPASMNVSPGDTTNAALSVTSDMADLAGRAMGVPDNLVEATPQNISDQTFGDSGKGYGEFVREVGLAVAESQKELDENSVLAAVKLAETEVPALVAMNQVVNEDGEIESVQPVIQEKAKLIQYIQPTFYQWSQVTLFAQFDIRAFEAGSQTKITSAFNSKYESGGVQGGLGFSGGKFSARVSGDYRNTSYRRNSETEIDSDYEAASSRGTSYMRAVLEPRQDTRFPAPIIAVQGPRLSLSATADTIAAPDPVNPVPQTLTLTITLFKKDSFRDTSGKTVDLSIDGPGQLGNSSITLAVVPNSNDTRLQGTVTLTRRDNDSAGTATVAASIGTLNSTIAIEFEPAPPAASGQ